MQRYGIVGLGIVLCATSLWLSGCAHDRRSTAQKSCPGGHCESGVFQPGGGINGSETASTTTSPSRVRDISELRHDGAAGNSRSSSRSAPSYGGSGSRTYGGSGTR